MAISKKLIAVVGATGVQGGSVVRSLLENADFEVLCITRNKSTPAAEELTLHGARVVEVDLMNPDHLQSAFIGCWGVFVNYTVIGVPLDISERLGKTILSIAALTNVEHVVFSSEPHTERFTNGIHAVEYLDVKARVCEWAQMNLKFRSFTPIMPGWFLENFRDPEMAELTQGFPTRTDDEGYLVCRVPLWGGREDVPWISMTDDFGDLVHGVFLNPMRWNHRPIQAVADPMSFGEMVRTFSTVTGKKARYTPCRPDEVALPFEMKELGLQGENHGVMFQYTQMRGGEYYGNGPTENQTAAHLKRAAFRAKRGHGREALMTVREWFEREYLETSQTAP